MKEVPQLASAVLTILFAAVMFVVGHLYIEKQVDEDSDHRQYASLVAAGRRPRTVVSSTLKCPPCLRDTRSGAANESAEPQQLSDVEPDGKTRLGGEMAPVDSRYSETIDYRSSCVRSRLAPARRAPLDLQEVH